jgi:hypothetical protein
MLKKKMTKIECYRKLYLLLHNYSVLDSLYQKCVDYLDEIKCQLSLDLISSIIRIIEKLEENECIRVSKHFKKKFEKMFKEAKKRLDIIEKERVR